jgi:hypothetical protein
MNPAQEMVKAFRNARFEAEEKEMSEDAADLFAMRAALRAFAAMEPTDKMREAAYLGEDAEYSAVFGVDEARAYILAAAEEGEAE